MVEFLKGKAAKVEQEDGTGNLLVTAEDVLSGKKITRSVGLLVLATGMQPQTAGLPANLARNEFRFLDDANGGDGIDRGRLRPASGGGIGHGRGCHGAALKAMATTLRSAQNA